MQSSTSTVSTVTIIDPTVLKEWFNAFETKLNNDKIEELLDRPDSGKLINAQNYRGATALMFSVCGNLPIRVRQLIKRSADINLQDYDGDSALHYAARLQDSEIFFYLLTHAQINVNLKNTFQRTPLSSLVYVQHPKDTCEMICELLRKGADENNQDCFGVTPLMYAADKLLNRPNDLAHTNLNYKIISILIKALAFQSILIDRKGRSFKDYIKKGTQAVRSKIAEITKDNSYLQEVEQEEVKPEIKQEIKQNAPEVISIMPKVENMTKIAEFCILNNIEFSFSDGKINF